MGIRFKTNQKCVPLHYGGTWVVIYLSPLVLLLGSQEEQQQEQQLHDSSANRLRM